MTALFDYFILQAGVFMGFAITAAVFGGIIIAFYSITIENADYFSYCYGEQQTVPKTRCNPKYPYNDKLGLTVVILILGIIEVVVSVWVSICLCLMKPCCRHLEVSFSCHGF